MDLLRSRVTKKKKTSLVLIMLCFINNVQETKCLLSAALLKYDENLRKY